MSDTFRKTDAQTETHRLAHMHSVVRGGCWGGGRGGDFRAFTGRAGVRLSEPWTAHMKLIQCGLLSSVRTGCSITVCQWHFIQQPTLSFIVKRAYFLEHQYRYFTFYSIIGPTHDIHQLVLQPSSFCYLAPMGKDVSCPLRWCFVTKIMEMIVQLDK